jgi:hypothetical protein
VSEIVFSAIELKALAVYKVYVFDLPPLKNPESLGVA